MGDKITIFQVLKLQTEWQVNHAELTMCCSEHTPLQQ